MKTHEKPEHDFITFGYLDGPPGPLTSFSPGRDGDHVKVSATLGLPHQKNKNNREHVHS